MRYIKNHFKKVETTGNFSLFLNEPAIQVFKCTVGYYKDEITNECYGKEAETLVQLFDDNLQPLSSPLQKNKIIWVNDDNE